MYREYFIPLRDQTFVNEQQRYVDLHRPDGTPLPKIN